MIHVDITIFIQQNYCLDMVISPEREIYQRIISVHDTTGLPWWGTVIFTTIMLRALITLPLAAYQASIVAKIENISVLEMPDVAKELQRETTLKARQLKWTAPKANMYYKRNLKKQFNELIVRDNCHPFKSVITVWFQLPTWIFLSAALRNLVYMLPERNTAAEIIFLQLSVGGFLWIPNLTQPDGLLICPLILGFSNLAIIEIQTMMRLREPTKLQRYATNFFRGFSVLLVPISATVPSVLCLYWTTSSVIGLCQNLFLMSNRVRKALRIPETPSTHDYPYQQLVFEIKEKNRRIFSFITRKK
nr:cytochrome c oxidase assembly protein COX18, mitochondrial isoform X2 [Halyomorpha halys]